MKVNSTDSDQRYELIAGELYLLTSPSFQHQVIVGEIWEKLRKYFRGVGVTGVLGRGPRGKDGQSVFL